MSNLIYDNIKINTKRLNINLTFNNRVTIVADNSGVGKSLMAEFLVNYSKNHDEYSNISYINSTEDTMGRSIADALKTATNRFIIIDRADILLSSECRNYIFFNMCNQYLIFGRGLDELVCSCKQLATIHRSFEPVTNIPTITLMYEIGGVY